METRLSNLAACQGSESRRLLAFPLYVRISGHFPPLHKSLQPAMFVEILLTATELYEKLNRFGI